MINKDAERSSYRARKGVDTSANAIFWVKEKKKVKSNLILVDNSPENSRKEISHICDFPLEDEMEAYYLTGVLNSDIVSEFVNAYVAWFISGHILERINIPKYSEKICCIVKLPSYPKKLIS